MTSRPRAAVALPPPDPAVLALARVIARRLADEDYDRIRQGESSAPPADHSRPVEQK